MVGFMRLFCFLLMLVWTVCASERPQAIVLFYADDLGYHDTSAYGCEEVPCPNLNRLAEEGLQFTDAHSATSVCTPSRYALLTGNYAWRQKQVNILPGDAKLILPTKDRAMTLPSMLQKAGYRTAVIGKWHLGLGAGKDPIDWNSHLSPGPAEVGFDYSFIMAATADRVPCVYIRNGDVVGLDPADPISVSYSRREPFPGEKTGASHPELVKPWAVSDGPQHNNTLVDGIPRIGHMSGGRAALWSDQDLADRLTEEAIAFIRRSAGQPIFLYFATNDIHVPRDPHQRFRGKSALGIRGDVTLQMDDCLGRIRRALQESGYDDCLLIFTSDNGPVISDGYVDGAEQDCAQHQPVAPFSGGKYTLNEGGTRMPFIVHWPGKVPHGVSEAMISQMDLGRSLAELVGVEIPEGSMQDSQNQLSALLGRASAGRAELIEQGRSASLLALRSGTWKLIPGPPLRLYDLSKDVAEKENVADQYPAKVQELLRRFQELTR